MNLWEIVKTVGTGIISAAVPGGPLIVGAINAVLPDDAQLPENATGQQAQDAISTIPAAERAALMDKQFDVHLEDIKQSHETVRAMLAADAISPHTTRPKIAYQAFQVVSAISLLFVFSWTYAVIAGHAEMVEKIQNGWAFVAAIVLPFVGWINAYFGKLVTEQKQKLDASMGVSTPAGPSGLAGLLSGVIGSRK